MRPPPPRARLHEPHCRCGRRARQATAGRVPSGEHPTASCPCSPSAGSKLAARHGNGPCHEPTPTTQTSPSSRRGSRRAQVATQPRVGRAFPRHRWGGLFIYRAPIVQPDGRPVRCPVYIPGVPLLCYCSAGALLSSCPPPCLPGCSVPVGGHLADTLGVHRRPRVTVSRGINLPPTVSLLPRWRHCTAVACSPATSIVHHLPDLGGLQTAPVSGSIMKAWRQQSSPCTRIDCGAAHDAGMHTASPRGRSPTMGIDRPLPSTYREPRRYSQEAGS